MQLETVKVLSQNPAIRGRLFDVYFTGEWPVINIFSIEKLDDVVNLKSGFSEQDLLDVRNAVGEVVVMRKLREIGARFTPEQWNAGFVSDAIQNQARGWCND